MISRHKTCSSVEEVDEVDQVAEDMVIDEVVADSEVEIEDEEAFDEIVDDQDSEVEIQDEEVSDEIDEEIVDDMIVLRINALLVLEHQNDEQKMDEYVATSTNKLQDREYSMKIVVEIEAEEVLDEIDDDLGLVVIMDLIEEVEASDEIDEVIVVDIVEPEITLSRDVMNSIVAEVVDDHHDQANVSDDIHPDLSNLFYTDKKKLLFTSSSSFLISHKL
jgi:hypothetical protein